MLANNHALTLLAPSKFPHGSRFNSAREKGASRGVERRPDHRPRLALGGGRRCASSIGGKRC